MTGDMGIVRRTFVKGALASTAALLAPHVSRAQDWPNRPVRFIVPLAAGGGLDFIARLVGEYLSRDARPAGVHREPHRRRRHDRHRRRASSRRRTATSFLLTNDNVASAPHVLQLERRLPQGPDAGEPARPPAAGDRRASLVRRELARRTGRGGEEAAGHGLRDLGRRLEPACAVGVVQQGRRTSSSITCPIAAPVRRSTTWSPGM